MVATLLFLDQSGSGPSSGMDPPRFSPIENPDLNDEDDDDERFVVSHVRSYARARVRRSVRLGRTRVRVIGNGDQSPSNHGRTMRVAPPESGRPRKSYCYHPRCLSRPMSTDASKTEGEAFRVIQDCSFDR